MELWDRDYFDMEVKAYIEIGRGRSGDFQFGLVAGAIDWRVAEGPDGRRLEFTWEGNDENDHACGSGWMRLKSPARIIGEIRVHQGDGSGFEARRDRKKK